MTQILVNLFIVGVFLLCLYAALKLNLYQCALLVGQTAFAFLFAVRLAGPFAGIVSRNFNVQSAYAEGIAYFAIWAIVLFGWPRLFRMVLKQRSDKPKFTPGTASLPGKFGAGIVSAIMSTGAIAFGLLLFPRVAGAFVESETKPLGEPDKTALSIYRKTSNIFRLHDISEEELRLPHEKAILYWGERTMDAYKKAEEPDDVAMAALARKLRRYVKSEELKPRLDKLIMDYEYEE